MKPAMPKRCLNCNGKVYLDDGEPKCLMCGGDPRLKRTLPKPGSRPFTSLDGESRGRPGQGRRGRHRKEEE